MSGQSNTQETRFVSYEWFNELNSIVGSIDDDSQTLPTGDVYYYDQTENLEAHGTHVTGTVAAKHYGWAPEANIYACQILGTWPSSPQIILLVVKVCQHYYCLITSEHFIERKE